jgi:hypothetical protein
MRDGATQYTARNRDALIGLLWVKLGRKLDVRNESAFPTITDIVDYGRER